MQNTHMTIVNYHLYITSHCNKVSANVERIMDPEKWVQGGRGSRGGMGGGGRAGRSGMGGVK